MTKSDVSWSDLAFLSSVRSALEVAVVGFVVIIIFFELQKRPPNETLILQRQRHPGLPPPSSPRILRGSSLRPWLRHLCTSSSVVGRRRRCWWWWWLWLSSVVCCVVRRTQEGGIEHQALRRTSSKGAGGGAGWRNLRLPLTPALCALCVVVFGLRRRSHRGPLTTATD